jgi:hypothetical protein
MDGPYPPGTFQEHKRARPAPLGTLGYRCALAPRRPLTDAPDRRGGGARLASLGVVEIERSAGHAERFNTRRNQNPRKGLTLSLSHRPGLSR